MYHYYLLTFLTVIWILKKMFIRSIPKWMPPGPIFKLPLFGQAPLYGNPIDGFAKLKKKYGDIFSLDYGINNVIVISDLDLLREVLEDPNFNGRKYFPDRFRPISMEIRGGHGRHGIIMNEGEEWKEQRRFALHHLRDFGFGKNCMEETIVEEALELCNDIKTRIEECPEIVLDVKVTLCVLNVLWKITLGKRFDLNDEKQQRTLERLNRLFVVIGPNSATVMLALLIPLSIGRHVGPFKFIKEEYHYFFDLAQKYYDEHEKTFDKDNLRDFVDCYVKERRRAYRENDTSSSFYGDVGHHNFRCAISDMFLAGSETTSTTLLFAIIFLLNNPDCQRKAQEELDRVVGKSRHLSLSDKNQLPYLQALISEIQRCGNVAPAGLIHSNIRPAKIRNYHIPPKTMVFPSLSNIMMDPKHFTKPEKFNPERFINPETGQYVSNPAFIPFGIGGRYCLGKSLANMELYLFLGIFLQQFTFLESSKGVPDPKNGKIAITRVPEPFTVKIETRY